MLISASVSLAYAYCSEISLVVFFVLSRFSISSTLSKIVAGSA